MGTSELNMTTRKLQALACYAGTLIFGLMLSGDTMLLASGGEQPLLQVTEPSTLIFLGSGLLGISTLLRRRQQAKR